MTRDDRSTSTIPAVYVLKCNMQLRENMARSPWLGRKRKMVSLTVKSTCQLSKAHMSACTWSRSTKLTTHVPYIQLYTDTDFTGGNGKYCTCTYILLWILVFLLRIFLPGHASCVVHTSILLKFTLPIIRVARQNARSSQHLVKLHSICS